MFRLIKLAAYLLLGYTLYELVLGMLEGSGGTHPMAPTESPSAGQMNRSQGASANSGGSRGGSGGPGYGAPQTVGGSTLVEEADGSQRRRRVGRGVVSR